MIGAPSIYALNITSWDAQGRPCNFGPSHDECQYKFLEKIPGTANYADYHAGYKIGYADGKAGDVYHHLKTDNTSASWGVSFLSFSIPATAAISFFWCLSTAYFISSKSSSISNLYFSIRF